MQTFKLFVSSPGDVMVERRRVENVASRLNGEFAGVARLEMIRWETKNYQAFSTFQAQIPRSVDCDLVIGILKWRLGTELPPDFAEKLPDGQSFPSGTAYEILTAIEKRQKGQELPDVYVFRFAGSSPTVAIEDPDREKIEHDWQVLKEFFQGWFLTAQGHFKAAFNSYTSEDDLEAHLEKLLRHWVAEKVAGGRAVRWPIAVKGSPFCGLAAFGARHAPVFFGRSHDIVRAVDLWREAGERNSPYLLVIGASGSGKSSLARAGLLPRLTTPGVIRQVDVWRVAAMRPSDSPQGPFAALAAALMQGEASLSKEEEGRGAALPEIALGDSRTPAVLASVLRHAESAAIQPVINALEKVSKSEHDRGNYTRDVRCDLVLLIDQLDELFAASISDAERDAFLDLVAAMVATGRIWVVTTLRADLYPRMLGQLPLKKLKELGATYDLAPPGPVELAEIVRSPAEAAGLVYETDVANGERLDDRLLRDAEQPDMLPLVQLALSRLFEGRQQVGSELRLPLAVYQSLGGLKGIIDEAGERAIASVGELEQLRLPRLLRQLAVPARESLTAGDALTVRAVPLTEAAPDQTTRDLLDVLVTARLLTVSGNEADGAKEKDKSIAPAEAQVRLTHQRVLEDWSRARTIVAESTEFYRVRSDLEESYRKWNSGGRRGELLLARGLPLAEAENIVGKYSDELAPEMRDYIKASRKRANRAQMIGWSAAAMFALVALGAGVEWKNASDQRTAAEVARAQEEQAAQRADRNFTAAKQTVDGLIANVAQGLRGVEKLQGSSVRGLLQTEQTSIDQLIQAAPDNPGLLSSRAYMFNSFVATYLTANDLPDATAAATQSLDTLRKLAAQTRDDPAVKRDLSIGLQTLGDVKLWADDRAGALAAYREGFGIFHALAPQDQGDAKASDAEKRGLAAYREGSDIYSKLAAQDQADAVVQRDLAVNLANIGDAKLKAKNLAGALVAYQNSIADARKLVAQNPGNAGAMIDLSALLEKVGNLKQRDTGYIAKTFGTVSPTSDREEASAAFQESLDIARQVAGQNPSNVAAQNRVILALNWIGHFKQTGSIGDFKENGSDRREALAAYQESLTIARTLSAQHPDDATAQNNLPMALRALGDFKEDSDPAGALAMYQEIADIRRKAGAKDPGNAVMQDALLSSLDLIASKSGKADAIRREEYIILQRLDAAGNLSASQRAWMDRNSQFAPAH